MATEYKCDICGNPATVHITKIIDGKKIKIHLCSACAEKASLEAINLPAEIFPKIQELEKQLADSHKAKVDFCPTCGAALSEIENGARFSCPDCYGAMGGRLFELFSQMHGATKHVGKSPKFHSANVDDMDILGKTLKNIEETLGDSCSDFLEDAQALADKIQSKLDKSEAQNEADDSMPSKSDPPQQNVAETKESLLKKLDAAISEERYEDAAKLRDEIKALS